MEKKYVAPKSEWISFDIADVVTDEIDLPDIGGGSTEGEISLPDGWGDWEEEED